MNGDDATDGELTSLVPLKSATDFGETAQCLWLDARLHSDLSANVSSFS
jgi:hypothetical protein